MYRVWKAAGNAWVAVLSKAIDRDECRRMDLRVAKRLVLTPGPGLAAPERGAAKFAVVVD